MTKSGRNFQITTKTNQGGRANKEDDSEYAFS